MISLSDVSMRFGAQVLFERVNWRLAPGDHYGLAGANGSGKSTLLRLMAGELKPEQGEISRPNGLRLGVLPQDSAGYDPRPALDVVIQGRPRLWAALRELSRMETDPVTPGHAERSAAPGHRLAELEAIIADEEGYTAPARAAALLEGLGLPSPRHARAMAELSEGYRLRVLLARTLFQEAELLLLDEPTNHLDIVSIRWLEGYLRAFPGTFVVVSHDRHFLNAVCTEIADLDYQELRLYPGDYERFEQAKALAERQRLAETERLEKKIAETRQFIDRFRAKASKARQAVSRQKQVERLAREIPVIKFSSRQYPKFQFTCARPSGREVLRIEGLTKGYGGAPVLRDLSLELVRGQKLAVVGPNGIGKSTLLRLIVGELEPDAGAIHPGYEVRMGYFGQEARAPASDKITLVEWLHGESPREELGTIRGTLGRVLFSGSEAEKSVRSLSGGEAARLLLARLMLRRDNLLVLDEPTNHLDMEGREALLRALRDYEGTLLFVSHDRHFVSCLADRVLVLTAQGWEDFPGPYEEYLAREGADFLAAEQASVKRPPSLANRPRKDAPGAEPPGTDFEARKAVKRETARLARQVGLIEKEIQRLERRIAEADRYFAAPGYYERTPWEEVARVERDRAACQAELDMKMAEWETLAARLDALGEAS